MAVKVRRVGNSNVVTLPRELERYGFTDGTAVAFVPMPDGGVLMVPEGLHESYMQELGAQIVQRRRRALDKLAKHDTTAG
jgi:antitoxin component of MazEF toxin-antitoxin module